MSVTPNSRSRYRGRFAPSPTGPLHFGSLVAAVASYLQARANDGEWLVRMEDIDPPREMPGAADDILRTLERFGLFWDGPVMYQRTRNAAYKDALNALQQKGVLYGCGCTRQEIADSSLRGVDGVIYPGTCRNGLPPGRSARAFRVRTDDARVTFDDRWQDQVACDIEREMGDFVLRRADGYVAYQLAVVVDDAAQRITEVVRGADLLLSTPRQLHLQRLLGLALPRYAHVPAAVNERGEKLSKQTGAASIAQAPIVPTLQRVLTFLGQDISLADVPDAEGAWRIVIKQWDPSRVPRQRTAPVID